MRTAGSVLFVHPAFLANRRGRVLHGVELFNLSFLEDLARAGVAVTVPAEPFWRGLLDQRLAPAGVEVIYTPPLRRPLWTMLSAAAVLAARRRRFGTIILGNNGRGVVPGVRLLVRAGVSRRVVLFAHQRGRGAYIRQVGRLPLEVHAVSRDVAASLAPLKVAGVYYGVVGAEAFHPRGDGAEGRAAGAADEVHFGVVGKLDPHFKGAHLAIEAWGSLPDDVRARARLHLCAFTDGRRVGDARMTLHAWKAIQEMPAFMRTLDALIVPSINSETFSQVMVQGMLTGLPVLAYDLGVLSEKLDRGGGLVFRTPADLAARVAVVVRDAVARARMGAAARATALERYVWSTRRFIDDYLPAGAPPAEAPDRRDLALRGAG